MRIVLADDHALVRDGVSSLLEAWGHDVVGMASNGDEAVELVERLAPDVVLMDVRMPGTSGLVATRRIARDHPDTAIVMLTVSEDEDDLFEAIKAGARGYLLKNLEAAQLRAMLDAVARGEAAISPATAVRIMRELAHPGAADPGGPDRLTGRERDVLELVPNTEVHAIERCSGHDGTYAVKKEYHAVSRKIARPTARQVENVEARHFTSDCPMAAEQLAAVAANAAATHPLTLLRRAYGI